MFDIGQRTEGGEIAIAQRRRGHVLVRRPSLAALEALAEDAVIVRMLSYYAVLRNQARACR